MQAISGLIVCVLLAGCADITTEVQPVNLNVKPALVGEDCTMVVLGFGVGHNTFQHAMANGRPIEAQEDFNYSGPFQQIRTIRTAQLVERVFPLAGQRCLEVLGEP